MSTAMSVVLQKVSMRTRILTTVLAIGLGVTLPRIFHLLGVGHIFLPMFVPIVLVAPILSIPFILFTSAATPFLSTLLFDMPIGTVSSIMVIQLTIVGTMQWLLCQTKNPVWIIAPAAVISERILTLGTSYLFPSLGISTGAILASYPGVLILVIIGIGATKFYGR